MRVLLCGGGSAGHVNPAIAIAETILKNIPETKIAYVCTISGIENELVDYKKYHINVKGLQKKSLIKNVSTVTLAYKAINESRKIIKDFCPDVVVGTGGYATFPVIMAAKKQGVKTVLHESNAYPGRTMRLLENKADIVFTNFEDSKKYLKNKNIVCCVGNPLRHKFFEAINNLEKEAKNQKYTILCCGGSLGAEKINKAAIEIADNLIRYRTDIRLILSTGKRSYYDVCEVLRKKRLDKLENLDVYEYIHDMPNKMAMADVVISRAGAVTITELSAMGKCSILVPSPNVTDNHQYKNAKALENQGAAVVITEDRLYSLTDTVKDLLANDSQRKKMEENIRKFYRPYANKEIYKKILQLVQNR